ncbi:hypothetical protein C8R42DRAFT_725575 [Lentinula raphanica]|nr:hypothetical protein C8R42DRAFT_725575 [Lentinula raphanica]
MDPAWKADCIKKFNALPRKPLAPSGRVPNVWHFDLRYIPLSPPSHMLFLFQKESQLIAQQILPVRKNKFETGIAYFPDNAKEAALEICFGLMHSFNTAFDLNKGPGGPVLAPYGPWKLTTDDHPLAREVEKQLKALGVKEERCKVEYANLTDLAHKQFELMYKGIKSTLGLPDIARAALHTPSQIAFSSLTPPDPEAWSMMSPQRSGATPEEMEFEKLSMYAQEFMNNEPLPVDYSYDKDRFSNIGDIFENIRGVISSKSLEQVKKEADAGDAQHAIDAGLRLKYGIKCKPDRNLSRTYLLKAALNEKASAQTRSMAHSMLTFWYTAGREGDVRARYVFAGTYHADEAVRIASQASPNNKLLASAKVLVFATNTVKPLTDDLKCPELLIHFKWVVKAMDGRANFMKLEQLAVEKKKMKNPNRYRCANVGCGIEADTGKMLAQCSGKCDPDKKPSYCGKRPKLKIVRITILEKEDWKNHKPFCKPGAPCSVIDPTYSTSGAGSTPGGSIRIPVHHSDGTTSFLSTSTMEPEMLKEIREVMRERAPLGDSSSLKMELHELDPVTGNYKKCT